MCFFRTHSQPSTGSVKKRVWFIYKILWKAGKVNCLPSPCPTNVLSLFPSLHRSCRSHLQSLYSPQLSFFHSAPHFPIGLSYYMPVHLIWYEYVLAGVNRNSLLMCVPFKEGCVRMSGQHNLTPSSSKIKAFSVYCWRKGCPCDHSTQGFFNSLSNPSTAISDAQGKRSRKSFFLRRLVIWFGTEMG